MNQPEPLSLETERLVLRPLRATDEDDVFAYQSDPSVVRYVPWPVRTREQVRAALAKSAANTRLSGEGDYVDLGMVLKSSGTVIGQSSLGITSRTHRQGGLGYVVAPAYARRGYALEASRAVLDHAFTALDLHKIIARIDTRNAVSARLAEKLGMRREAEFIDDEMFKGEWSSIWIYAMLASQWTITSAQPRGDAT